MTINQYTPDSAVEEFFSVASPMQVRRSLFDVFMYYLIHLDMNNIPKDLTMVSEDMFLLMQFLEKIERERMERLKRGKEE